jgi:DNA transformation protein
MTPEEVADIFQDLGPVRCRRMFGGLGIYAGDQMFGLVAGGEIYLKADDIDRPRFDAAGSRPFTFERQGKPTATSYWLLPSAALDDPAEAALWGRAALEAARRAATVKKPARKR